MLYEGINKAVASLVPADARRILDLGCGTGALGGHLRSVCDRHVTGITYSRREAELASNRLSSVTCADLNAFDLSSAGSFDCVILSHVLEHLYSPANVLQQLHAVLGSASVVIVALPNVVWWKQRLQFVMGRWRYADWGVLDRTHFRFFDRHSSAQLLEENGYEILQRHHEGPFPMGKAIRQLLGEKALPLDRELSRLLPGLFAMQFLYVARLRQTP